MTKLKIEIGKEYTVIAGTVRTKGHKCIVTGKDELPCWFNPQTKKHEPNPNGYLITMLTGPLAGVKTIANVEELAKVVTRKAAKTV